MARPQRFKGLKHGDGQVAPGGEDGRVGAAEDSRTLVDPVDQGDIRGNGREQTFDIAEGNFDTGRQRFGRQDGQVDGVQPLQPLGIVALGLFGAYALGDLGRQFGVGGDQTVAPGRLVRGQ